MLLGALNGRSERRGIFAQAEKRGRLWRARWPARTARSSPRPDSRHGGKRRAGARTRRHRSAGTYIDPKVGQITSDRLGQPGGTQDPTRN